jgi:hypothetical protein
LRLCNDPDELDRLIRANTPPDYIGEGFSAAEWIARPANFALVEGDDLGLFEAGNEWPGPLTAHVLFASRGKPALDRARRMLAVAFAWGATEILGEPRADNKAVRWFIRQLGFEPYGQRGKHLLVILSHPPAARKVA